MGLTNPLTSQWESISICVSSFISKNLPYNFTLELWEERSKRRLYTLFFFFWPFSKCAFVVLMKVQFKLGWLKETNLAASLYQ